MNTKILGNKGEKLAKDFLKKQKYKILETNYSNKLGEIDIIAKDNDTIVFVEVKTRETSQYGLPREAITSHKQNKIKMVAKEYLTSHKLLNQKVRFDCVDILGDEITHIKNAFE